MDLEQEMGQDKSTSVGDLVSGCLREIDVTEMRPCMERGSYLGAIAE